MANVRAMLARVQRLEVARTPRLSPFEQYWGSLDAWEGETQAGVDAGLYDRNDMADVILAISQWHDDGVFA